MFLGPHGVVVIREMLGLSGPLTQCRNEVLIGCTLTRGFPLDGHVERTSIVEGLEDEPLVTFACLGKLVDRHLGIRQ